jgi:ubiquinone/menaquinone biosynthesis C-methylase UbiE
MAYGATEAAAFATTRHLPADSLSSWREAIARYLHPRPGMRLLDLGSGTGMWATAFVDWYGIEVVAVEPAAAMRARSVFPATLAGHAEAIPLESSSVDAAWLSTVLHHVPSVPAAAAELRRVLRSGALVLIRSAFAGRHENITLFRYFTEAIRVLDSYPSVAAVRGAFEAAGFAFVALESVPQLTADSLQALAGRLRREAHTPLTLISDQEYETGLTRLREAARQHSGPVVDSLDLLVLRAPGRLGARRPDAR